MTTLTRGQSFTVNEEVTYTKLHNLIDNTTVGNIATADIDDDAITTVKILNANVTAAKLATDSVETAKIKDANVTTAKIADSNVTKAKIEDLTDYTVLGNVSGGAAAPAEVAIIDDDSMATASATNLCSGESIKAYVDASGAFGALVSRNDNTAYQASTDGYFIGIIIAGASTSSGRVIAYSDSNASPTTVLGGASVWVNTSNAAESAYNNYGSFCIPVLSGDYYKGVKSSTGNAPTVTYYWRPVS